MKRMNLVHKVRGCVYHVQAYVVATLYGNRLLPGVGACRAHDKLGLAEGHLMEGATLLAQTRPVVPSARLYHLFSCTTCSVVLRYLMLCYLVLCYLTLCFVSCYSSAGEGIADDGARMMEHG